MQHPSPRISSYYALKAILVHHHHHHHKTPDADVPDDVLEAGGALVPGDVAFSRWQQRQQRRQEYTSTSHDYHLHS